MLHFSTCQDATPHIHYFAPPHNRHSSPAERRLRWKIWQKILSDDPELPFLSETGQWNSISSEAGALLLDLPSKKEIREHAARSYSLKLPLIFVISVILPALFLAYMGLRTIAGDTEQALEEQVRQARRFQELFEEIVQDAIQSLRQNAQMAIPIEFPPTAPIRHAFILDQWGNWIVPNILTRHQVALSAQFKAQKATAERLEFAAQDIAQALAAYRSLAQQSQDSTERAIALSGAARCARKQGNGELAVEIYTTLAADYPLAFDASGAHLATYAHLQTADLALRAGNASGAIQTLDDWVHALRWGAYPLGDYSATRHALDRVEKTLLSLRETAARRRPATVSEISDLRNRLYHMRGQIRFVEQYGAIIVPPDFPDQITLLETTRDSALYRSGHTLEEGLYLIAIVPLAEHRYLGAHFDLSLIHARLTVSALGQKLRKSGLEMSLLDDRAAVEFRQIHADAMPVVAELDKRPIGIQVGLRAKDTAAILDRYKQRRWLLLALILLLMASIGFGGYLVTRDAAREVHLSRLRSHFVANVSHELKTPLASIRLFAETLMMGRFREEAEREQCVETILHESERLSRLVDNVLDFSRIEAGRKTYHLREEDLAEIARSCLDAFGYRLREEGFELQTDIPTDSLPIALDRDGVTEAILNLLDNAVKYSPEEKEITCRIYSTTEEIILEVADRGIGIPVRAHAHIFDTFFRAESSRLHVSGAGLGLTLVKHVMDAHQGCVEVESAEGQGSTFRLIFPRQQETAGQKS
jgi:signal transduction histidine kinase